MKITFYRENKITDKVIEGKVADLTFQQLIFTLKYAKEIDITQAAFFALKDSENDKDHLKYLELKDNGFFIAGEVDIQSKSRRIEHIINRTVLTFDVDKPKEDIWEKFLTTFPGIQGVYYSTISSNKDAPRYRILVPLSRPVGSADYVKLMEYVMNTLGQASFDKTTAEVARVMFLPAICKDQNYNFKYRDGEPFNVDKYLTTVESFADVVKRDQAKANYTPPKEKKGIVGAFNRAYTITDTIENFLSEIYIKGGSSPSAPRYKYKDSKGMPGARVYDDNTMFYSAHDTDPAGLKNLDAFNLVKLHLFNNDFGEMRDWAMTLPEVKAELEENTELIGTTEEWVNHLYRDPKKGHILNTPYNLQMILLNDPNLAGMFRINTLTYMIEVCKDMAIIGGANERKFKTIEDADMIEVQIYIETSQFNVRASKQQIIDIVCQVARLNKYDPVKDYLDGLVDAEIWDGIERIPTMFTDYLMVKDTPIVRAIARKVMAAAVWRVMKPGIKWEGVPVLRGIQGSGKSTFIQKLYKSSVYDDDCKNWVNNTAIDYSNIDKAIQRTKGFWGIELAELANTTMSSYSNELMKAFISADRPVTRIPYDKFEITLDRKCIFWGTTNAWLYISDQTGARRFLPLDCEVYTEEEKFECLQKINKMPVDQLWAEAMSYYKNEVLYFTVEEEKQLNVLRLQHTEESSYEAVLSKYVNMRITLDWEKKTPLERRDFFQTGGVAKDAVVERTTVTFSEIAYEALGKSLSDIPRKALRDIEVTLFNLGWQIAPYPLKTVYGQSKTFVKRRTK